jgi:hypothetical protein
MVSLVSIGKCRASKYFPVPILKSIFNQQEGFIVSILTASLSNAPYVTYDQNRRGAVGIATG